ncbi:acetyl-CoA synthetase-like protein [Myriangium duriaei CBS 260.36]|uniref:Acetyl-CoA synthetase-like protein n=1 Tax=Myriangium duriaei CBS 260.36 TaxID=1168546 RepID=A0A9P4MDJ1_9PEZI|nr:acetyl-CoA synthetase-like protein [Myriangium duriaei CBS 260.36]
MKLDDVDLVSKQDLLQVFDWNKTTPTTVNRCIHEVVKARNLERGKYPAVCSWDASFSHGELDNLSDRLAKYLISIGIGPGVTVPFCFDKCAYAVVTLLAILRAGGACTALSPSYPRARNVEITSAVAAKIILASPHHVELLEGVAPTVIGVGADLLDQISDFSQEADLDNRARPGSPAFVAWTSGSTGNPKGIVLEHKALVSSIIAHGGVMGLRETSRVLQFSAFTFDVSIGEVFATLMHGGCVCVPSEDDRMDNLATTINRFDVNVAVLTPTVVSSIKPEDVPQSETLLLAGEKLSKEFVDIWSSQVCLINGYGPSEAAMCSSANINVKLDSSPSNIGWGLGSLLWVVDPENYDRLAPLGAVGELLIEGPILARGYLNDKVKTEAAFIENPAWLPMRKAKGRLYRTGDLVRYDSANGNLVYVGRKDNQVKIRGQRVELGEIMHNIAAQSSVRQAAVVLPRKGAYANQLVAFVCFRDSTGAATHELQLLEGADRENAKALLSPIRSRLSDLLSHHMIPQFWVLVQDLPLTRTSKLDLKKLSSWAERITEEDQDLVLTREDAEDSARLLSDVERILQQIWARVLNAASETITPRKSFFELGGDSISAMAVVSAARSQGLKLTVQDILRYKTLEHVALHATPLGDGQTYSKEVFDQLFDVSPIQKLFFDRIARGASLSAMNHYNHSVVLKAKHHIPLEKYSNAICGLVTKHSMLRARFSREQNWQQRVLSNVEDSYLFESHSLADTAAIEELVTKLQSCVSIQDGPVFVSAVVELESSQYLVMVAHHLVIDLVSWRLVLQDLQIALETGDIGSFKPMPFASWVQAQDRMTGDLKEASANAPVANVRYWAVDDSSNVHSLMKQREIFVSQEVTSKIFGTANDAFRTEPVELLLAALAKSFAVVFTDRELPVFYLEQHGREAWKELVDPSDTVGWFTTFSPISAASDAVTHMDFVRYVKDSRRRQFMNGLLDFGTSVTAEKFGLMEVAVNYVGRYQQLESEETLLHLADDLPFEVKNVADDLRRLALIDITIAVKDNRISIHFAWNRYMSHQDKLEQWMDSANAILERMAGLLTTQQHSLTLTDFPLLQLDYPALDILTNQTLPALGLKNVENIEDMYPCSPMQSGILLSRLRSDRAYHVVQVFEIASTNGRKINTELLRQAWQQVVDRHAVLRTFFIESASRKGTFDQVVVKPGVVGASLKVQQDFSEHALTLFAQPKALQLKANDLPHRFEFLETTNGHYGKLDISHAVVDGASTMLLLRDFALAYEGTLDSADPPLYSNYIAYLQSRDNDADLLFWANHLKLTTPCHIPIMPPHGEFEDQHRIFKVDVPQVDILSSFCQAHGITLANLVCVAWSLVLKAYTGEDSICFGFLTNGRDIPVERVEGLVGPLINMLICTTKVEQQSTPLSLVQAMQENLLSMLPHQHTSMTDIQHALNLDGQSLFNTVVSFQRFESAGDQNGVGLTFNPVDGQDPTEYALSVNVDVSDNRITTLLSYSTGHFLPEQVENIAATFISAIMTVVANHAKPINELSIISQKDTEQLISWNSTEHIPSQSLIHEEVSKRAQLSPDAVAVQTTNSRLTFAELDDLSSRLAQHLIEKYGSVLGWRIPICFEKSPRMIITMLAILKVGGAYAFLNPSFPVARLAFMATKLDARLIVTSSAHIDKFTGSSARIATIDDELLKSLSVITTILPAFSSKSPAIITFTSGSTGEPKGAILTHSSFCSMAEAQGPSMRFHDGVRVLQYASNSFDVSNSEIFTTLMHGGTVCLPTEAERMNSLGPTVGELQVNWLFLTPTVAHLLSPDQVPSLKALVLGGEAIPQDLVDVWSGKVTLINSFGPSEASIWTSNSQLIPDTPGNIIGKGLACNMWAVHAEDHSQLVPIGAIGELVIDGPIVGQGYINEPEKTRAAFITNPNWLPNTSRTMYKTGDLVRVRTTGDLEYVGRKDTQIKFHSQRIEVAEIEHHLRRAIKIREDVELAVELITTPDRQFLAAFVAPKHNLGTEVEVTKKLTEEEMAQFVRVQSALADSLPNYMIPTAFIKIRHMPTMTSSKIDRKRLREIGSQLTVEEILHYSLSMVAKRAPSTGMELRLQHLWAEVLGMPVESIGADDNWFRLGGDSLMSIHAVSAAQSLKEPMGLTVSKIFQYPVLSELALHIEPVQSTALLAKDPRPFSLVPPPINIDQLRKGSASQCKLEEADIEDILPATPMQEGLLNITARKQSAYVLRLVFKLPDTISVEPFKNAWQALTVQHALLRTRLIHAFDKTFQVISRTDTMKWGTATSLASYVAADSREEFSFGERLVRYGLVIERGENHFIYTAHHAVYDGWTVGILFRQLSEYLQHSTARPLPSFGRFIAYQADLNEDDERAYWQHQLSRGRPAQYPNGTFNQQVRASKKQRFNLTIGRPRKSEILTSTILRAAWALLMARYSESQDVIFGATLSGRNAPIPGIEDILGPTITTVPVRVEINPFNTVKSFLEKVQDQASGMIPYEHSGMHKIRQFLDSRQQDILDLKNLFIIQPAEEKVENMDLGLTLVSAGLDDFDNFAVVVECQLGLHNTLEVEVRYDDKILTTTNVEWMMGQYQTLLSGLCKESDELEVHCLPVTGGNEMAQLLNWSGPLPPQVAATVHGLFTKYALDHPEDLAIHSWDGKMTYRQLNAKSNHLAQLLLYTGRVRGENPVVAICFDKSLWAIISILAVLKTGASCVALNPSFPSARLEQIISATKTDLVLCGAEHSDLVRGLVNQPLVVDSKTFTDETQHSDQQLPQVDSTCTAFIVMTSGSTGIPKGIVLEHGAFCTSLLAHSTLMGISSASRVSQYSNYVFDVSLGETFSALFTGATLCIPSEEERLNDLEGFLVRRSVSVLVLTPTIASMISPQRLPAVDILVLTGEAGTAQHVKPWLAKRVYNAYGPAEATVWSGVARIQDDAEFANIGTGSGCRLWITEIDNHDHLVPLGMIGELLIEGPILARGYLNDCEKTADSFVVNPAWACTEGQDRRFYTTGDLARHGVDGSITYMGRKDTQVKIHGQRLEIGDVEHSLITSKFVKTAAVVQPNCGRFLGQLVALVSLNAVEESTVSREIFVVLQKDARLAAVLDEIREELEEKLPEWMIPRILIPVNCLPTSTSGKLDRRQILEWVHDLDEVSQNRILSLQETTSVDRELNQLESQLRGICAEVLNLRPQEISPDRSLLTLGLDSITAMQVTSRGRTAGLRINVQDVLRLKTLAKLAAYIGSSTVDLQEYEVEYEKYFDLSPIQKFYFDRVTADAGIAKNTHHYNQSFFLKITTASPNQDIVAAVDKVVQSHHMLKARFVQNDTNEWHQFIPEDSKDESYLQAHQVSSFEEIAHIVSESQANINITDGPVFAAGLFTMGTDKYLALVAHHLVIDLVSWRIVLEDIAAILKDGISSPLILGIPFQTWLRLQDREAHNHIPAEASLRQTIPDADLEYWGMDDRSNLFQDEQQISISIDRQLTASLIGESNDAMKTEPVEIILAALAFSFNKIFDDRHSSPAFFVEGHGREPWNDQIDLSRTVGWFTSLTPLHAGLEDAIDILDAVRRVKDTRRSIPANGWRYFSSRYLTQEGRQRYAGHDVMEIAFNFLGSFQQLERDDAALKIVSVDESRMVSNIGPRMRRLALIEISAVVYDRKTEIKFSYNSRMKHLNRLQQWTHAVTDTLEEAILQLSEATITATLADFPLLPCVGYDDLNNLFDSRLPTLGLKLAQVEDIYAVSPMQNGILLSQTKVASDYMLVQSFELVSSSGLLSVSTLQQSWQKVIARHPTLRTIFVGNTASAETMYDQLVLKHTQGDIQLFEADNEDGIAALSRLPSLEADLVSSRPCHRLSICTTPSERVFCKLEISHTLIDGGSMDVLIRDLAAAHAKLLPEGSGPLYSHYIAYLQSQDNAESLKFWNKQLYDVEVCHLPTLTSPFAKPESFQVRNIDFAVANLTTFCSDNDITLANLFQAAWGLVLGVYTGQEEVSFGYLSSGRDVPVAGVQEAVGTFVNMLICRCNLREQTIMGLLKKIQEDYINCIPHQHVALVDIQHQLGLAGQSLFNTAMSLQRGAATSENSQEDSGISIVPAKGHDPTEYDVSISIGVSEAEVNVSMTFKNMESAQARNISSTFEQAISSIIRSERSTMIPDTSLLSHNDQAQVAEWNAAIEVEEVEACIHDLFLERVKRHPHAKAFVSWDAVLTYHELEVRSANLAHKLRGLGVGPEVKVPMLMEKSASVDLVMLAILRAGGAFVPLSSTYPKKQIADIVFACDADLVIVSPCMADMLHGVAVSNVLEVDWDIIAQLPAIENFKSPSVQPKNAAYLIHTSGSTGKPKGIVLTHANLCSSIKANAAILGYTEGVKYLQFASYVFDNSIGEIFATLMTGATLYTPSEHERMNELTTFINKYSIDTIHLTPSVMSMLNPPSVPSLRHVILGGERVTQELVQTWADKVRLVISYGPSEATIWCTNNTDVTPTTDPANIGQGVGGMMWIVEPTDYNRLAPIGKVGELLIEGPIVARGYNNDEEKTKAAFVQYPGFLTGELAARTLKGDPDEARRFYLTGDLCRYNPDGSIVFVSRKDVQVKLRGQRIDLSSIEYELGRLLLEARQCAVEVLLNSNGNQVLAAFMCFKDVQIDDDNLVQSLSESMQQRLLSVQLALLDQLPSYMVPGVFIPVSHFSISTSGKLDRKMFRSLVLSEKQWSMFALSHVFKQPPKTPTEHLIRELWCSALKLDRNAVGVEDSFFRIGGDSLTAMRLVAEAQKVRVPFSVADVFRYPRLRDLAAHVDLASDVDTTAVLTDRPLSLIPTHTAEDTLLKTLADQCRVDVGDIKDVYPTSPLQEGLISVTARQQDAYMLRLAFKLPDSLGVGQLKTAWQTLINAHDILRTRIVHDPIAGSLQVVLKKHDVPWHFFDGSLEDYLTLDKAIPTKHGDALARYGVASDQAQGRYFVFTVHHAIYDGWSMGLLFAQIESILQDQQLISGNSFKSFIGHLQTASEGTASDFWKAKLAGSLPPTFPALPSTTYEATTNSKFTTQIPFKHIPDSGLTLSNILRAGWAFVLARYNDTDDVVLGVTLSGRSSNLAGIHEIVGPTLTTVPVRVQLDFQKTVKEYLEAVQSKAVDMMPYEHTGLQKIRKFVRAEDKGSLDFRSLFVVQSLAEATQTSGIEGLELVPMELENFDSYPLVTECTIGDDDIGIEVRYDRACISQTQVRRMVDHFGLVIRQLTEKSTTKTVGQLSMLTQQDLTQILDWNQGQLESLDVCVHQIFEQQVARSPDAPAVEAWDGRFTYRELDRFSNALARQLGAAGVKPEVNVPFCFDKSKWMVVAMMGIIKAGGACAGLGPTHPIKRLEAIIEQSQATVVVVAPQHAHLFQHLPVTICSVDASTFADISEEDFAPVLSGAKPSDPIFNLFTSGSTGTPKGIVIEHRNLASSAAHHGAAWHIGPGTRVFNFAASTFDVCCADIFTTTMRGGCICLPSEQERLSDLSGAITRLQANWAFLTPTVAGLLSPDEVPTLKTLVLGGEAATRGNMKTWAEHVELIICYGPAETSIYCMGAEPATLTSDPAYLGRGIGCKLWVVDPGDWNQLVPLGCVGELLIDGPIVSRGYLGDAAKTKASFIEDPAWLPEALRTPGRPTRMYRSGDMVRQQSDGTFRYVRRKDTQVKYHGQRVEIGEIETYLSVQPAVHLAGVVQPKAGLLSGQLVALLSFADQQANVDHATQATIEILEGPSRQATAERVPHIEAELRTRLPEYMIPKVFVLVSRLPLTFNGKLDRRTITTWVENMDSSTYHRILDLQKAIDERPVTDLEQRIRKIWSRVLNLSEGEIGLHKSFFALSGDSITAMQVSSMARAEGLGVSVRDLLRYKTIAMLSPHVSDQATELDVSYAEVLGEPFELSPIQQLFFDRIHTEQGQNHYNQSFLVEVVHPIDVSVIHRAVSELVEYHSMLRARFRQIEDSGRWIQLVEPNSDSVYTFESYQTDQAGAQHILSSNQSSLDIENGPVFATSILNVGSKQYISMIAHHLVIDLVSWRVIANDLMDIVQHGKVMQPKGLPFQSWTKAQEAHFNGVSDSDVALPFNVPLPDLEFWVDDITRESNLHRNAVEISYVVDKATSDKLFSAEVNQPLNSEPVDVILAALTHSFGDAFPDRKVPAIHIEGHGREPWSNELDISRTVGWFTTITPLVVDGSNDLQESVMRTKDRRRAIPASGFTYFTGRHVKSNSEFPKMEVAFNYLGRFQQLEQEESLFRFPDASDISVDVSDVGGDVERLALIDISVAVLEGQVNVRFSYNKHMRHIDKLRLWIDRSKETLEDMVNMLGGSARQLTLSDLPLLRMSEYDSLDKIHAHLGALGIDAANVQDIYPVSPMQQGILLSQIKLPKAYWVVQNFELSPAARVDIAKLRSSWQAVVRRHPMLRTCFLETDDDERLYNQLVLREIPAPFSIHEEDAEVTTLAYEHGQLPHRLAVRTHGDKIVATLEINHALVDGASVFLILRDFALAYTDMLPANPGPLYSDYLGFLQQQAREDSVSYWTSYLKDVTPTNVLFSTHDSKSGNEQSSVTIDLDHAAMQTFCSQQGVTMANLLQAAWAVVLRSLTGSDDVSFGYLTSGRDVPIADIENAVGPFINMLVCRTQFGGMHTVLDTVAGVQNDYIASLPHQSISLAEITHPLKLAGQSLFNTTMSVQRTDSGGMQKFDTGVSFVSLESQDPTEYDIAFGIGVSDADINVTMTYSLVTIGQEAAKNVSNMFRNAVHQMTHQPLAVIADLNVQSAETPLASCVAVALRNDSMADDATPTSLSHQPRAREIEAILVDLWVDILGIPSTVIGSADSFFRVGGDSVSAIKLVRAAKRDDLQLNVAEVFQYPILSDMAKVIASAKAEDTVVDEYQPFSLVSSADINSILVEVGTTKDEIEDVLPTTDFQDMAVTGSLMRSPWMVNYFAMSGRGTLDPSRLQSACQTLLSTIPILRTTFHLHGDRYLQIVHRHLPLQFSSHSTTEDLSSYASRLQRSDLLSSPLSPSIPIVKFFHLTSPSSPETKLILRLSHAQYDGLCLPDLWTTLSAAYNALPLPHPSPFASFIAATHPPPLAAEAYWRALLADSRMTHFAPRARARYSATTGPGVRYTRHIALDHTGGGEHTFATLLKAAWALVAAVYTASEDVVFGTVVSGRNMASGTAAGAVGPAVGMLPVRCVVPSPASSASGTASGGVLDVLDKVRRQQVECIPHENLGFRRMIKECTKWRRDETFGSIVQFQNLGIEQRIELGGTEMEIVGVGVQEESSDVLVVGTPVEGGVSVSLATPSGRLSAERAERLLAALCGVLERWVGEEWEMASARRVVEGELEGLRVESREVVGKVGLVQDGEVDEECLAVVREAWRQVLDVEVSDVTSMFDCGADMVAIGQVCALYREKGYLMHLEDVAESETIKEQARVLSRSQRL